MHLKLARFTYEAILESALPLRGKETVLDDLNKCYVTGTSNERAILYIHDIKGWTNKNARRLADLYAKEVDATVYLPDFFGGEIPPQTHEELLKFDFPSFKSRNDKDARRPEIHACAAWIRQRYPKVGVVGYCFGGWSGFDLGSRHNKFPPDSEQLLIDCLCVAHPAWLTEAEIRNVGVPTQIIAPEFDNAFDANLKNFANDTIPTLKVPYSYVHFPVVEHRFASQPDLEMVETRDHELWKSSFRGAQVQIVNWLTTWL